MSPEFWAILGVGASGFAVGVAILALGWPAFESLRRDISGLYANIAGVKNRIGNVEQRLARIEGWIAGRFREENIQS